MFASNLNFAERNREREKKMVRGNIRGRRDHLRGPRAPFRKAFLPRPPFDLARFDLAFQKDSTPSADDNDLTNVS